MKIRIKTIFPHRLNKKCSIQNSLKVSLIDKRQKKDGEHMSKPDVKITKFQIEMLLANMTLSTWSI